MIAIRVIVTIDSSYGSKFVDSSFLHGHSLGIRAYELCPLCLQTNPESNCKHFIQHR